MKSGIYRCSTPYGIRGFAASQLQPRLHPFIVLNALRHQRFRSFHAKPPPIAGSQCSTPYGIRGFAVDIGLLIPAVECAQRLTASEVSQRAKKSVKSSLSSAQRLTASEVSQFFNQVQSCCVGFVLNALRHQRFRSFFRFFAARNTGVLNALRHQRFRSD